MHGESMSDLRRILIVKTQKKNFLPHLDDEDEPNNGGGIFWENNGQPIKIFQRGKEDAVADEDLLLGWDMKEKKFCGQLVSSKDNLLTVIF